MKYRIQMVPKENRSTALAKDIIETNKNSPDMSDELIADTALEDNGEKIFTEKLQEADILTTNKPKRPKLDHARPNILVIGVGGAGGNAIKNMMDGDAQGVKFIVANTDAQAMSCIDTPHKIQLGTELTEGLGAGSKPEIGRAAAQESYDLIKQEIENAHIVFLAAGMGGGTGTGAISIFAKAAQELGILTVGVVTKPFHFEGTRRMAQAEEGIEALRPHVDTLLVIPNQNLFRLANETTTFGEAFQMADRVLNAGISCVTDLMIKEGLINLDFADIQTVIKGMGSAIMGVGVSSGQDRAKQAAEQAITNPLVDDLTLTGAKGLLINISGGEDMTLYEIDEAASLIRSQVDDDANIIIGATFDEDLAGSIKVAIVASGLQSSIGENALDAGNSASVSSAQNLGQSLTSPATRHVEAEQDSYFEQVEQTVQTSNTPHSDTIEELQEDAAVNEDGVWDDAEGDTKDDAEDDAEDIAPLSEITIDHSLDEPFEDIFDETFDEKSDEKSNGIAFQILNEGQAQEPVKRSSLTYEIAEAAKKNEHMVTVQDPMAMEVLTKEQFDIADLGVSRPAKQPLKSAQQQPTDHISVKEQLPKFMRGGQGNSAAASQATTQGASSSSVRIGPAFGQLQGNDEKDLNLANVGQNDFVHMRSKTDERSDPASQAQSGGFFEKLARMREVGAQGHDDMHEKQSFKKQAEGANDQQQNVNLPSRPDQTEKTAKDSLIPGFFKRKN